MFLISVFQSREEIARMITSYNICVQIGSALPLLETGAIYRTSSLPILLLLLLECLTTLIYT